MPELDEQSYTRPSPSVHLPLALLATVTPDFSTPEEIHGSYVITRVAAGATIVVLGAGSVAVVEGLVVVVTGSVVVVTGAAAMVEGLLGLLDGWLAEAQPPTATPIVRPAIRTHRERFTRSSIPVSRCCR